MLSEATMTRLAQTGIPLALAAMLLMTSCDAEGTGAGAGPRVDDLPRLSLEEVVRIGSLDDPVLGFSRIAGVRISESGEVYVLESMPPEVRVFSPDGRWLRTIGRAGEGPGEFSGVPNWFGLLADTLWVFDSRKWRFSWFGPTGAFLFETPATGVWVETDLPGLTVRVMPWYPLSNGLILSAPSIPAGQDTDFSVPEIRFDRSGEVVDTIGWRAVDSAQTMRPMRVNGQNLPFPVPSFGPESPVVRVSDGDSIVITWSDHPTGPEGTLEIARLGPNGDTLYSQSVRYELRPVPGSLMDSIVAEATRIAPTLGIREQAIAAAVESAVDLPEFRPPLRTTRVGSDGTIWIELNTASTDEAHWILIGPDGTPRGRLTLPIRMSLYHSDGSDLWAVDPDEYDVPWLVRLRIVSPE